VFELVPGAVGHHTLKGSAARTAAMDRLSQRLGLPDYSHLLRRSIYVFRSAWSRAHPTSTIRVSGRVAREVDLRRLVDESAAEMHGAGRSVRVVVNREMIDSFRDIQRQLGLSHLGGAIDATLTLLGICVENAVDDSITLEGPGGRSEVRLSFVPGTQEGA
jgi:hypothetical protein